VYCVISRHAHCAIVKQWEAIPRTTNAGWCKIRSETQVETSYSMATDDNSGPKSESDPPVFRLPGPRPSFLEILERREKEREAERSESKAVRPKKEQLAKKDQLSKSTIRSERYPKWLMPATFVSAIFFAVWVTWSIHELRNFAFQQAQSVNDSLEIAQHGILAANRRAEAIEKTYDRAVEASRTQLRAYVSVLGISTQNGFEKSMFSSLNYKNVGQTPALGLRALTDVVIVAASGSDVKPPRMYSTSYSGDDETTIVLGEGITKSDPVSNRPFKEAELGEFRAGSTVYVVWGAIYYSDVFGKNHYTRFCRYYQKGEPGRWSPCQTGNDSD
jgi:hypothetical protein